MEPHREEQNKASPPSAERKPKRFRIVKLEDRIAPSSGGGTKNCHYTGGTCWTCGGCGTGAHCY
jgi:hypothetical protein